MIGTANCIYETPCGWCSKWDKECDKKMYASNDQKEQSRPVDEITRNIICKSEDDHEWECRGMTTTEITYVCKKCCAFKSVPIYNTITTIQN